jgi:hypothetical protein
MTKISYSMTSFQLPVSSNYLAFAIIRDVSNSEILVSSSK